MARVLSMAKCYRYSRHVHIDSIARSIHGCRHSQVTSIGIAGAVSSRVFAIPQSPIKRYTMKISEPFFQEVQNHRHEIEWKRFRYCQAWTGTYKGVLVIKSYDTVVAAIHGGALIKRGRYSVTTSKQCTQIFNAFKRGIL